MKDEAFKIRAYDKSELALLYFPKLSKRAAWKKLKYWFSINKDLRHLSGKRYKTFTPKEVGRIIGILGEPFENE